MENPTDLPDLGRLQSHLGPSAEALLSHAGIEVSDLSSMGDALPALLDAIQRATAGNWMDALSALEKAGEGTTPVEQKLIALLASQVPDQMSKKLLRALLEAEPVSRDLAPDRSVESELAILGLTPDDLRQAGNVAPELWDAIAAAELGDIAGAFGHLARMGDSAPDVVSKAVVALARFLP